MGEGDHVPQRTWWRGPRRRFQANPRTPNSPSALWRNSAERAGVGPLPHNSARPTAGLGRGPPPPRSAGGRVWGEELEVRGVLARDDSVNRNHTRGRLAVGMRTALISAVILAAAPVTATAADVGVAVKRRQGPAGGRRGGDPDARIGRPGGADPVRLALPGRAAGHAVPALRADRAERGGGRLSEPGRGAPPRLFLLAGQALRAEALRQGREPARCASTRPGWWRSAATSTTR